MNSHNWFEYQSTEKLRKKIVLVKWAQSFTSLMADLRQDINGVSSFRRCLNRTFPWRNCSVKTFVLQMRRVTNKSLLFWVNLPYALMEDFLQGNVPFRHITKCKTSVYILMKICLQWSKRLGPDYNIKWCRKSRIKSFAFYLIHSSKTFMLHTGIMTWKFDFCPFFLVSLRKKRPQYTQFFSSVL